MTVVPDAMSACTDALNAYQYTSSPENLLDVDLILIHTQPPIYSPKTKDE
jgi:hypothetical protein